MKFGFLMALAFVMFTAMTRNYQFSGSDNPKPVANAIQQVNQYQIFMFVANQYMKNYSGGARTLYWSDIKAVDGAPSGATSIGMPSNWKIVVAADMSWVACTQMDERAAGMLQQLTTKAGISLLPTKVQSQDYIVVGAAADIGRSTQCN